MMAVMPGAHFLNAVQSTLMSRYDVVCIHTIVGYAPASAAHFSTRSDGYIWQSRDTRYRGAANLNGNHRVISIENEDHGPAFGAWNTADGRQVPGFTPAQVESIAKICAWAHKVHGIPLVLCPDSKPGSRGIAYHRQGIDSPNNFAGYQYRGRVAGGELWSNATGKVCPGDRRINQLVTQIIPRARQIAGLDAAPTAIAEDEDMQLLKGDQNSAAYVVYWNQPGPIAARKRIPNAEDPGYKAALAAGYQVKTVPQAVIDGIPDATGPMVELDYARFVSDVVTQLTANLTAAGVSLSPSQVTEIAQASATAVVLEFKKEGN